jgi:hypothetical protein
MGSAAGSTGGSTAGSIIFFVLGIYFIKRKDSNKIIFLKYIMSKLEIETYYRQLVKMGVAEELIPLCMADRFPEAYDKEAIVENFKMENELILSEITKLGFRPFHETISNNTIYGQTGETEEGSQAPSEETAYPKTEPDPESQTDC